MPKDRLLTNSLPKNFSTSYSIKLALIELDGMNSRLLQGTSVHSEVDEDHSKQSFS